MNANHGRTDASSQFTGFVLCRTQNSQFLGDWISLYEFEKIHLTAVIVLNNIQLI
jgi:hypothetical protein